jgi:hypothetical protein
MDVEYAHIADPLVGVETRIDVPPVRGPGGIMTAPTTRTHTKFQPVKRGAAMTVRLESYLTLTCLISHST